MSEESILDLLSRSLEGLSCPEMTTLLGDVLGDLGFDFFVLVRMAHPDAELADYVLTGDYPQEWRDVYGTKRYAFVDPVVRYVRKSQEPFRWRDAVAEFREDPYFGKMKRMMRDAARHGLDDGYVFPVHRDRGLVGYLSVGGAPVDLSPLQMALVDALAKRAFWQVLRVCQPKMAAEMTAPVSVQLTRREMEALSRLADGLTSNEIGQVLNISSNTVDWYMNGIQDKLGARNRHHAVAIAFRLGLIN